MTFARIAACVAAAIALAPVGASAGRAPNPADLEAELVCPTCKTTLDQSDSLVAQRMKAFIRVRIARGWDEEQIKSALVAEFGPGVLAEPPGGGFGLLAWLLPLVALAAGAVTVAILIRRWSGRRVPGAEDDAPLDPRLERLVDEELARFDT